MISDRTEWDYIAIGCSTCGGEFRFPGEIVKTTMGTYQCIDSESGVGCFDRVNELDDARLRALPIRQERVPMMIPGAPLAASRTGQ